MYHSNPPDSRTMSGGRVGGQQQQPPHMQRQPLQQPQQLAPSFQNQRQQLQQNHPVTAASAPLNGPQINGADVYQVALADPSRGLGFSYITTLGGTAGDYKDGQYVRGLPCSESKVYLPNLPPLEVPGMIQDYVDVIVALTLNAQEIYVQLLDQTATLESLAAQMAKLYVNQPPNQDILVNPRRGQVCAAFYAEDQAWYRASVIERPNPRQVTVFFIDYGNTETVTKTQIKRLEESLHKIPPQAVTVSLNGVTQLIGTSLDELQAQLENRPVTIQLMGNNGRNYVVNMEVITDTTSYSINERCQGQGRLSDLPAIVPPEPTPAPAPPVPTQSNPNQNYDNGYSRGGPPSTGGAMGGGRDDNRNFGGGAQAGGFGNAGYNQYYGGYDNSRYGNNDRGGGFSGGPGSRGPPREGGFGSNSGGGGFGAGSRPPMGGGASGSGCRNCGQDGHFARECPEPRKGRACHNCGKEGHISRECPEPRKPRDFNRDGGSGGGNFGGGGGGFGGASGGGAGFNRNTASGGGGGFGGNSGGGGGSGGFSNFRSAAPASNSFGGSSANGFNNSNSSAPAPPKPASLTSNTPAVDDWGAADTKPAPTKEAEISGFGQSPSGQIDAIAPCKVSPGQQAQCVRSDGDVTCLDRFAVQLFTTCAAVETMNDTCPPGQIALKPDQLRVGQACVAMFQDNWYRAVIEKVEGDNISICYVDYGNCETRKPSDVFQLHKDDKNPHFTLPAYSVPCRLYEVKPRDNAASFGEVGADSLFEATDTDSESEDQTLKSFNVTFMEYSEPEQLWLIKLEHVADGTDLGKRLKTDQLADARDERQYRNELVKKSMGTGQSGSGTTAPSSEPKEVKVIDQIDVAPIKLNDMKLSLRADGDDSSLKLFDVQPVDYSQHIDNMISAVPDGSTADQLPADKLVVGQMCLALYEDEWFRARILTVKDQEAHIRYVDYGNRGDVNVSELKVLKSADPLIGMHELAVPCRLADYDTYEWSNRAEADRVFLETLTDEHECQVQFLNQSSDGVWNVRVFAPEGGIGELVAHFKKSGLIESTEAESSAKEASPNIESPIDKEKMKQEYEQITETLAAQTFGKKSDYQITINLGESYMGHHVDPVPESSPNLFYVQLQNIHEDYLAQINGLLDKVDRKSPLGEESRKLNAYCAADYDEITYRGIITKINEEEQTADVFFVDFGNTECKKFNENKHKIHIQLYPVVDELKSIVHCAVACKLCGIEPADNAIHYNTKARQHFNEVLPDEAELKIKFCGVAPEHNVIGEAIYECEMHLVEEDNDVCKALSDDCDDIVLLDASVADELAIENQLAAANLII